MGKDAQFKEFKTMKTVKKTYEYTMALAVSIAGMLLILVLTLLTKLIK